MATASYPTGIKVFVDSTDVTAAIFGVEEIIISDINNTWRGIDISQYIKGPGIHKIEVTCTAGVGRVEARLEIE
jgi:hypothetical protein